MLADFLFSVNAVLPLFLLMLLGYVMKKTGWVNAAFFSGATWLVFYIALPAALFRSVYTTDIAQLLDARLAAFAVISSLVSFCVIWAVCAVFVKEKSYIGALVQGSFRGNFAFLGLPLLTNLAGDYGMARAAVILAFALPIWNICSILVLSVYGGGKVGVKTVVFTIAKNPFIIAIALGFVVVLAGITLPQAVARTVGYGAAAATPLALITLGGGLMFVGFDAKFKYALAGSVIKVIVLPAAFITAAYFLGFRGADMAAIMVMGGVPSAVVGYAMVVQMGGDGYIAGMIVAISTLASAATLTIFIYITRILGLT
jgi:predicted permease